MQKDQQKLEQLIKGKKVAFIGAGVSHKTLIKEFVELGAHVTLCDQKKSVEDFGDYAATIRELGIDLSLGENYLDGFKGQDIIMRTPGLWATLRNPCRMPWRPVPWSPARWNCSLISAPAPSWL